MIVRFDNQSWTMNKNGDKGIMLSQNYPTRIMFVDCKPNETVDDLYNKWRNLFGEEA